MTTISLTYNERNQIASKTIEYILSLGVFKTAIAQSSNRRKTMSAINDAREGKNITHCSTFEEYLKAVSE